MANPEHLAIFNKGEEEWNRWRKDNPEIAPDLHGTDFSWAELSEVDLSWVDLSRANLSGTKLRGANLSRATLRNADLTGADLSGANLGRVNLSGVSLREADLRGADLTEADLRNADLGGCDLFGATVQFAKLDGANLTDANLWETLREGWSIKGVICERAFMDKGGEKPSEFAPGEFEKLYSEQQVLELIYPDGMTRFELYTLPHLIHHLEKVHQGARLRLRSVEEAAGGAKVSIVVEDEGEAGVDALRRDANDDENRVVLLVAAVHDGHGRPWIHRKTRGPNVRGRARVVSRRRRVACGAASEMGDIVEGRAVGEFPPLIAVLVLGLNCQHGRHLAVARDEVFPRRQRKGRLLHDQAVFLQPPVRSVEFPL